MILTRMSLLCSIWKGGTTSGRRMIGSYSKWATWSGVRFGSVQCREALLSVWVTRTRSPEKKQRVWSL